MFEHNILYLSVEQIETLKKLTDKHKSVAHIYSVGPPSYGHIEVEFYFPHRYIITKNGTLFECYDLELNKFREVA